MKTGGLERLLTALVTRDLSFECRMWTVKKYTLRSSAYPMTMSCEAHKRRHGYLTRHNSRLKKLPPMTRYILKEVRTGLIYGLHCNWEPPSPKSALLTILHGAMTSKVEWAKRFGVQRQEGIIPGLLCRTNLADHGELKGAEATEAETQFGFGIDLPTTMSGDRKGGVESQHHADHAHLDRKLPGTTRGKRPGRGDELCIRVFKSQWRQK